MCGIAGFLNYQNKSRREILAAMSEAIAHRGPDGDGAYLDENIGLAHRRLAIIDLKTGAQPMFSADKRFVTVFNGEIYNYRELREELKNSNCEFRTNSDTEVIAEAIREWGIRKAIARFRGMFALCTYDFKEKKLYMGRDRTGIKPLYYVKNEHGLFFASEQKSLLKVPEISRKVNATAFHDFLTLGYPVSPATCWQDISMFPPANFAEISCDGKIEPQKYWSWEYKPETMSLDDALNEARSVLQNSLKYHVRSDVPLASFLSGGIDSSLLVTLLAKGGFIKNLQTFNVGFDETQYDESGDAEHVAELAGTEHHQIVMNQGTGDPAVFEKILAQYDEPFADSSCLPTYFISKEMRKHVKVVISGDGGDELFGGYHRLIYADRINKIRHLPMKKLMRNICASSSWVLGEELSRKLRTVLNMAIESPEQTFCFLHTYFSEKDKSSTYTDEFAEYIDSETPTWERMNKFILKKGQYNCESLMQTELALTLHADYLRKVDIASSAHGLEVRVPFLDDEVMDFAARVPMDLKIHSGRLKYLLRELARKDISPRIAEKDKWGFGVPFDRWSQGEMKDYLHDLLFSSKADGGIWRILKRTEGEELWNKFINAGEVSYLGISRYQIYQRIFMLASTQVWFKTFNPVLG